MLAHNAYVAVGKIDTRHLLLEILGIDPVCPADALQKALVFQDEVCMARSFIRMSLPMVHSQVNPVRPHVRLARSTTVRKVQDMVRHKYGMNYRVELFGSTSYGVDSPTSDLDLVIVVRTRFHLHSPLSLNSDQDTYRMNGFPPSLDLKSLPRKRILLSMDHLKTQDSRHSQAIYNVKSVTVGITRTSED